MSLFIFNESAPKRKPYKKDRWMTVKVQVSLSGDPSCLIYSKDRDFVYNCEREFGVKLLGEAVKGFWKVRYSKTGELYFDRPVKAQDW